MVLHSKNVLPGPMAPRSMEAHINGDPITEPAEIIEYEAAHEAAHNPLLDDVSTKVARIEGAVKNPATGGHALNPNYDWADRARGIDGGSDLLDIAAKLEANPNYTPKGYEKIFLGYMEGNVGWLEAYNSVDEGKLVGTHPGASVTSILRQENEKALIDIEGSMVAKKTEVEEAKTSPRKQKKLLKEAYDLKTTYERLDNMDSLFEDGHTAVASSTMHIARQFMDRAKQLEANPTNKQAKLQYEAALAVLEEQEAINSSEEVLYRYLAKDGEYKNDDYEPPKYAEDEKLARLANSASNVDMNDPAQKARYEIRKGAALKKLDGLRREMADPGLSKLGNKAIIKREYIKAMQEAGEYEIRDHWATKGVPDIFKVTDPEEQQALAEDYAYKEAVKLGAEDKIRILDTGPAKFARWMNENRGKTALAVVGIGFTVGLPFLPIAAGAAGLLAWSKADVSFRGLRETNKTLTESRVHYAAKTVGPAGGFRDYLATAAGDATLTSREEELKREQRKRKWHIAIGTSVGGAALSGVGVLGYGGPSIAGKVATVPGWIGWR